MDAKEYLNRIILHEGKITYLLNNPDLSPVKKRCFRNLLGILCCNSLFEDQPLRADTEGVSFSEEGLNYRIQKLREVGFSEEEVYSVLISSRDKFVSEKKARGYFGIHIRRLHCDLYKRVLKDLEELSKKN